MKGGLPKAYLNSSVALKRLVDTLKQYKKVANSMVIKYCLEPVQQEEEPTLLAEENALYVQVNGTETKIAKPVEKDLH